MTAESRAKGIFQEIKAEYGEEIAMEMIHNIVYNVGNYDRLTYEERSELYETLYEEIVQTFVSDIDYELLSAAR